MARHPLIAQIVLEYGVNDSVLRPLIQDYLRLERHGTGYMEMLRQFTMALADLPSVGSVVKRDNFRNALLRTTREALRTTDGIVGRIRGVAHDDYRRLQNWIDLITRVVPNKVGNENAELLDLESALLEILQQMPNCPNPDRVGYYRLVCNLRKQEATVGLTLDDLLTYLGDVADLMRASWCNAYFYSELYWRSMDAWGLLLSSRPTGQLSGEDEDTGVLILEKAFAAFQNLWKSDRGNVYLTPVSKSYSPLIMSEVREVLPRYANHLIAYSWQESVNIGKPNPETAALYAKELYEQFERQPTAEMRETLQDAADALRMAIDAAPAYAEALYLMAVLKKRSGGEIAVVKDLSARIERARRLKMTPLNSAFLAHARALLETGKRDRASLLRDAMAGYHTHVVAYPKAVQWVSWAWSRACNDLKATGAPDWTNYRSQLEEAEMIVREAD